MTEQPTTAVGIPEWDLSDRMRKALRTSGIGVQEMADYLGVARNTVSTWINGKIVPSVQTQRLWALRCGVPYEWVHAGAMNGDSPPPGIRATSGAPATGLEPVTCRLTAPDAGIGREYYPQAA